MTTATPKAKKPKKAKKVENLEPVRYPEIRAMIHTAENPITVQLAKDLLGWTPESNHDYQDTYFLVDETGTKVRLVYNTRNRPYTDSWCRTLAQDILNHNWADSRNGDDMSLNGETIVISKYGQVLSGQHRLIALVLAEQMRTKPEQVKHWKEVWGKDEVSIEGVVIYGVSESPKTVRTIDNARSRTLSDVLFTEKAFADVDPSGRKTLCRMVDNCVRILWSRLGRVEDEWSPSRTHSAALDFIASHPTVLKAVKHIYDENDGQGISRYVPPGAASAMLYLMGMSATEGKSYHEASTKGEMICDLANWDKACEFWTVLSSGSELGAIRSKIASLVNGGRLNEKLNIIALSWHQWLQNMEPEVSDLELEYHTNEDGITSLLSDETFGGIDLSEEDLKFLEKQHNPKKEKAKKDEVEPKPKKGKKVKEDSPSGIKSAIEERIAKIKAEYEQCFVCFRTENGYVAWGEDAEVFAQEVGESAGDKHGIPHFSLKADEAKSVLDGFAGDGIVVMIGQGSGDTAEFVQYEKDEGESEPTPDESFSLVEDEVEPEHKSNPVPRKSNKLRGGTN